VVIVEVPGEEFSVGRDGAFYFDDSSGAEIGPGEFFFAGPDNFYRTTCGAGQARGFDCGVSGVLAAVGGAGVGNDYANICFGDAKRIG